MRAELSRVYFGVSVFVGGTFAGAGCSPFGAVGAGCCPAPWVSWPAAAAVGFGKGFGLSDKPFR